MTYLLQVPNVTVQQAQKLFQQQPDKYVFVDVRNKDEREVSMIPGSKVITMEEYLKEKNEHKDKTALCYW